MAPKRAVRAVTYSRISETDAPDDEHGVQNQADAAEKLVAERDWELVARYIDNDVRASKGKKSDAQYHLMMAAASRREFENVVVFQTSRLWRNRRERADGIETLRQAAVSVIAVKGPSLDMSHAYGRAMAGLLGEFDTLEAEVKAERQQLANAAAAKAGQRFKGGPRPFGYEADHVTVVPAEVVAVRLAADQLLGGCTIATVCRMWDGLELSPPQGAGQWRPNSVKKILRNPRIAGLSVYRGEIVGTGNWTPLLPEATWRAIVALLDDPGRRNPAGARTLLGGVARCRCGNVVSANLSGSGARIYRCQPYTRGDRPGPHVSMRLAAADDYVERVIAERLSRPDLAELLTPPARADTAELRAEAAGIRASLDRDAVDELRGVLTRSQLAARTEYGRKRLAEIDASLAEVGQMSVLAPFAAVQSARDAGARRKLAGDVWAGLDLSRQHAVIQALCTVTLLPSRPGPQDFDPGTVRIDWATS